MSFYESDPRDKGYVALYIAIVWHKPITSETALRIAEGKSNAKPGNKITHEMVSEALKLIQNPSTTNINSLITKHNIDKYDLIAQIAKRKFKWSYTEDEGVISILQIDEALKRLYRKVDECNADPVNCENCFLYAEVGEGMTLCSIINDMEFDEKGRPEKTCLNVPKINYKKILQGETTMKGFRIYKTVSEMLAEYINAHGREVIRDIISKAILEYIVKREAKEKSTP